MASVTRDHLICGCDVTIPVLQRISIMNDGVKLLQLLAWLAWLGCSQRLMRTCAVHFWYWCVSYYAVAMPMMDFLQPLGLFECVLWTRSGVKLF